jgi:hypothetical protein
VRHAALGVGVASGEVLRIEVKATAIPSDNQIGSIQPFGDGVTVVVADQLSAAQRAEVEAQHAGWFDRRGHLRLVTNDVFIDTEVAPGTR